ncbi:hypothetical protein WN48_08185 [Eufriesea mexicana]|uniref:Uncharacterized protein n=1 Tax=Eufriesea mexicana TaxID=516756 RepID=A0A310S7Y6_9HYME|nr:hypothetical protein WN48_08185 [Eufriesea mexicana]
MLAEDRRGESRVSSGVGCAFASRTPVVEWSGCGDAYKVPGVAVPQLAVVALYSLVSCTWTNARNEEAVGNLAVDRRRSCAVVKCSHARCDCPERPCRHSVASGGTRYRVQSSSPTFSQASQVNQQQQQQQQHQQQPCECAERVNCSHTGGECECGEEAKPCSHTVKQRRSRRTCDCSGSGSQPCTHKSQHEGRIKRVKCRVKRAGCAMARCTAELAMLHLHWGLATECAPCRPRALTRRLCRRQQSDNELYRSNSFKFERFERSKDECATPLRKQVSDFSCLIRSTEQPRVVWQGSAFF